VIDKNNNYTRPSVTATYTIQGLLPHACRCTSRDIFLQLFIFSRLYLSTQPGQLSLAISPWVHAISTSESWDVNRHTTRCTSPVSVVSQCKYRCLAEC